jgi:hypothetical protein
LAGVDAAAGRTGHPEIAVALTDGRSIVRLAAPGAGDLFEALRLAPPPSANGIAEDPVARLHVGTEFCERLIPSPTVLSRSIELAAEAGLALTLTTPTVPDDGLARLRRLFRLLPDASEVVVNDYGVLRLLLREFPGLEPVAGRQLCKTIKDPRLPTEQWARLNPGGVDAPAFRDMLGHLGIGRIELDVPPYARPADLRAGGLALSVHAPFGYAVRGRVCRIGSLRFEGTDKFRPGQACGKECLRYACALTRPSDRQRRDLDCFQRGNSIFYRHDAGMRQAMWRAIENGWIDRIVLAGDWHEPGGETGEGDCDADHRPH